jgi:NADH-quinone oxidoreductase subunit M
LRVLPPFFPHVHERAIALVAGISLFSAALAALLSLVQKSLRGVIGWLAVSQSGLVLVGLCAGETEGVTGALLQSLASGLGITGLVAGLIMLEARTGTSDLASLSGLCQRRPHLAGLFLLLGTAVLGIPGSLGFLADDMLVHGPLREHPVLSCGVLGVTVLSGAAFLRAYVRAFFGPALPGAAAPDLLLRERAVLLTLIDALFGFGLFPSTIL